MIYTKKISKKISKKIGKKHKNKGKTHIKIRTNKQLTDKKLTDKQFKNKSYIIVKCLDQVNSTSRLHFNILEDYLHKLGFNQNSAVKQIEKIDKNYLKENKISYDTYCSQKIRLPNITNVNLKYCCFMWINPIKPFLSSRYYNVKKYLINSINKEKIDSIYDKSELYNNFKLQSSKDMNIYIAESFNILEKDKYTFNGNNYYILRPIDSYGGKDILYISSKTELEKAIQYYDTKLNYRNIIHGKNVIASKYIINPYLFKGKKFHLRMYYMISYIEKVFNSFLMDCGNILTAYLPYTTDLPFIKEIHDSHLKSSENDYFYPEELEKYDNIKENKKQLNLNIFHKDIKIICKTLSKILINSKIPYTYHNEGNGFKVIGIDIMIDADTMKPKILECNIYPGYSFNNIENSNKFSQLYFKWINEVILEPTFKYKDQYIARKHPTYIQL
jgi:hypothetical protein